MATTRPRHTITETDEVAAALDEASRRWPGASRADLLRRLLEQGHQAIRAESFAAREARAAVVERTSGMLDGVYRPDELERLRADWPE